MCNRRACMHSPLLCFDIHCCCQRTDNSSAIQHVVWDMLLQVHAAFYMVLALFSHFMS